MQVLHRAFSRYVLAHASVTFVALCASFGLFGAGTLNLFKMFSDNWDFITLHGLMALKEGAALQLLELLMYLGISMLNYVVFKACEHSLVHRILHPSEHKRPHENSHPPR